MIRNYLLTALRNIFRQKGYTMINVTGLAIGIVSCLFIVFYILDEFSYDRFHEKGDRIYRLLFDYTSPNGEVNANSIGPYRLAEELKTRFPEIEKAVRLSYPIPLPVRSGEIEFIEDNIKMERTGLSKISYY